MNYIKTLSVLAVTLAGASAPALGVLVNQPLPIGSFSGTDRNWFNPANWSTGRVPDENTIVVLDGDDDVVIDPSQAGGRVPGKINVNSIWTLDAARLEVLPGTQMAAQAIVVGDAGQFDADSSDVETTLVFVAERATLKLKGSPLRGSPLRGSPLRGSPLRGSPLRGSPAAAANTYTGSTVINQGILQIGLGGREPAGIQKAGAGTLVLGYGYYANVQSGNVVLGNFIGTDASGTAAKEPFRHFGDADGNGTATFHRLFGDLNGDTNATSGNERSIEARIDRLPRRQKSLLELTLHYGFKPAAGDTFQIITADRLAGEFEGLPEGALVGCTEDNVGLTITYRGGDGNDVVLSAADQSPDVCRASPKLFQHVANG